MEDLEDVERVFRARAGEVEEMVNETCPVMLEEMCPSLEQN